jgi:hypothetical protein
MDWRISQPVACAPASRAAASESCDFGASCLDDKVSIFLCRGNGGDKEATFSVAHLQCSRISETGSGECFDVRLCGRDASVIADSAEERSLHTGPLVNKINNLSDILAAVATVIGDIF